MLKVGCLTTWKRRHGRLNYQFEELAIPCYGYVGANPTYQRSQVMTEGAIQIRTSNDGVPSNSGRCHSTTP